MSSWWESVTVSRRPACGLDLIPPSPSRAPIDDITRYSVRWTDERGQPWESAAAVCTVFIEPDSVIMATALTGSADKDFLFDALFALRLESNREVKAYLTTLKEGSRQRVCIPIYDEPAEHR